MSEYYERLSLDTLKELFGEAQEQTKLLRSIEHHVAAIEILVTPTYRAPVGITFVATH